MTLAKQKEEIRWPSCNDPFKGNLERSRKIEATVLKVVSRLSLEEKVAQMIQAEFATITPEEAGTFGNWFNSQWWWSVSQRKQAR